MAKIKKSSKRTAAMKQKITKTCERTGRKKIAKMLSLMGFHDDDTATTVKIMRQRLRQIEERTKIMNQKRSTIKKIVIKFGGKKLYLNRDESTKFPLETSISEITARHDDDMEIDSNSENQTINYDDGYQSFEENRLEMVNMKLIINTGADDMETDLRSENPNSGNGEMVNINDFITSVGGSDVVLVIEKKLTKSDCDKNQGRLLIPVLQVKNNGFLTMNEQQKLDMRESISVEVFDPETRKLKLNLSQWKMKNENYVLKTNWRKLVIMNGLKENVVIRVLAFRVDRELCFAVVRV